MNLGEMTDKMVREGIGDREISPPYLSMLSMAVVHLDYADRGMEEAMKCLEALAPEFRDKLVDAQTTIGAGRDALILYLQALSKIGFERETQKRMEQE